VADLLFFNAALTDLDAIGLLRRHPKAGAAQTDLGNGIRCLVHRRHRIFYRIEPRPIVIVRIIHHAHNAMRELKAQ
jgi:toxin ParE1/3/4